MKHVYFFAARENLIKVGYSANVRTRLMSQRQLYTDFELLGVVEGDLLAEKSYHIRFAAHHVTGEWFRDSPELRAEIKTIIGPEMPEMPNTKAGGRFPVDWTQTPYAIAERNRKSAEQKKHDEIYGPLDALIVWSGEQRRAMTNLPRFQEDEMCDAHDLLRYAYIKAAIKAANEGRDLTQEELSSLAQRRDRFRLFIENIATCNAANGGEA